MNRPVPPRADRWRFLKPAGTLLGVVLAQGILTRYFQLFAYFDLPLVYCVYHGFTRASRGAAIAVGSTLGVLQDSLYGTALGTNGFAKTVICFVAASTGSRLDVDQWVTRVLALWLATLSDVMLKFILGLATRPDVLSSYPVTPGAWALSAVCNVVAGMILFGYRERSADEAA